MILALPLYAVSFLMPVTGPGGTGAQTLVASFGAPVLWPFLAGHLTFWVALALLFTGCWRIAGVVAFVALAVNAVMAIVLCPAICGISCELLGMGVIGYAGLLTHAQQRYQVNTIRSFERDNPAAAQR
jgi:hypothetical protein